MSKNSEGFVFVAIDGRFMAMVKCSAKTRLPSHVELSTKPTYWGFYTKNKYGIIMAPLKDDWMDSKTSGSWQSGIFGPP
jgi:hypothetical protein